MGTRRHSLIAGNIATRSEYDDVTTKHNNRADNKLSRELAELARAQKVISRDMAFERKALENSLRVPSQRRGSMPALPVSRPVSLNSDAPASKRLPSESVSWVKPKVLPKTSSAQKTTGSKRTKGNNDLRSHGKLGTKPESKPSFDMHLGKSQQK